MNFGMFTTILYALVALISVGIIFEKPFVEIEDKLDEWIKEKVFSGKFNKDT